MKHRDYLFRTKHRTFGIRIANGIITFFLGTKENVLTNLWFKYKKTRFLN